MVRRSLSLSLLCLAACPAPSLDGDDEAGTTTTNGSDTDSSTGDESDTGDGDPTEDSSEDSTTGNVEIDKVSILFVIDNSGSMGEEQSRLTTGVFALTDALDAAGLDWRIGVTTSDNGNPWCPAGTTTPEGGKLVLSSCRTRLGDFLFSDTVDVQDIACTDICPLETITVQPTATLVDPDPKPRPWIEKSGGVANVAESIDDVLSCVLPQGVNGCGFESQLESAYLSLARSGNENEANYGFFEEGRLPVIVFLTDEADCSYNKDWADIFAQDGNKVFWSNPNAAFPTSAVCWNAGVDCEGDPSNYTSCDPMNKGIEGWLNVSDEEAVLHPVARYTERFATAGAIVFAIDGVMEDGWIFYADVTDSDPAYQEAFGIGPGCTAPGGVTAVPPVRMRVVAETNAPGSEAKLYSVCGSNYGPAFADIGQTIVAQL
jgi:hypothetical protein